MFGTPPGSSLQGTSLITWNYLPIHIIVIWRELNKQLFYWSKLIALIEFDCRFLLLLAHRLGSEKQSTCPSLIHKICRHWIWMFHCFRACLANQNIDLYLSKILTFCCLQWLLDVLVIGTWIAKNLGLIWVKSPPICSASTFYREITIQQRTTLISSVRSSLRLSWPTNGSRAWATFQRYSTILRFWIIQSFYKTRMFFVEERERPIHVCGWISCS